MIFIRIVAGGETIKHPFLVLDDSSADQILSKLLFNIQGQMALKWFGLKVDRDGELPGVV